MKKKLIFDADITMGVPNCDVDDGLALIYALGYQAQHPEHVDIVGLTTSYGNNNLSVVYENAQRVCADLALDIPVLEGAPDKDHPLSDAAQFLVDQANAAPGEISLCVTGSTTNLKGTLELDQDVLCKFKEIVFMGGITQSLVFNGVIMDELNFSCDAEATFQILESANRGAPLVVMTANNCLPAYFSLDRFKQEVATSQEGGGYLFSTCVPWFETMQRWYGLDGFVCWDVLASAYILEPELFTPHHFDVVLDKRMLEAGYLEQGFDGAPQAHILAPQISDPQIFCKRCLELWGVACLDSK